MTNTTPDTKGLHEEPFSLRYRIIQTAMNTLYDNTQPANLANPQQTKLDHTIDTIKGFENSNGTTFHIPEYTQSLLQILDTGTYNAVKWSDFAKDYGTLQVPAKKKKLDDLSAFLRSNFFPKAGTPLRVQYETIVNAALGPDVVWGIAQDDQGTSFVRVTYTSAPER